MKIQKILLFVGVVLLSFTSCVDEKIMDDDSLPGTISLVLTTDAVRTSTSTKSGETLPDELKVSECAIAIFREVGGQYEKVGFAYQDFNGVANGEYSNKPAYKFTDVEVKTGEVKILALANYSKKSREDLEALSYKEFRALADINDTYASAFDPAHLIKFGELETKLSVDKNTQSVNVVLTQLAARVDVSFKVDVPEVEPDSVVEWKFAIEDLEDYALKTKNPPTWDPSVVPAMDFGECKGFTLLDGTKHENHSQGKFLYVGNNVKTVKTIKTTWMYQIGELTVNNINLSSQVFLSKYDGGYVYNPIEANFSQTIPISEGRASVSFYTYEKKNDKTPLTIQVTGQLLYGDSIRTTEERFAMEYKWDQNGWGASGHFTIESQTPIGATSTSTSLENIQSTVEKRYKLELRPEENGTTCHTNGLVHGNIYEVTGKINVNDMSVNFEIGQKPWVVQEIDAVINDVHYLFVSENDVKMPNIGEYFIKYNSDTEVECISAEAYYIEFYRDYDNNVLSRNKYYNSNASEFPSFEVMNGQIKIKSSIPTNYFPKNIRFKVQNAAGLSESITVVQYPPLYMTAMKSKSAGPSKSPDTKNINIFTITTIAENGYKIGNPKNNNGQTFSDEESNELVSPKFIIASRRGAVLLNDFSSAASVGRCNDYWEIDEQNKRYENWRVPTLAELTLLNKIQDADNIINYLFNSDGRYWSACIGWYYDFGKNTKSYSSTQAYIRCVHDVY